MKNPVDIQEKKNQRGYTALTNAPALLNGSCDPVFSHPN
jgi:hypothetical protein